jgi:hypothetical protein
MKLISSPTLTVTRGRIPHSLPTDTRVAVYFQVDYSYSCTVDEIKFIEDNSLVILEKLTIIGFDPADLGNDIDLRFSIRPQFTARPPDIANADFLKKDSIVNRSRTLFVLETELSLALNVNGLNLDSVKANVKLIYAHIGESKPETV